MSTETEHKGRNGRGLSPDVLENMPECFRPDYEGDPESVGGGRWITGHEADVEATENTPAPTPEQVEGARYLLETDDEGRQIISDWLNGDDETSRAAMLRAYERADRRRAEEARAEADALPLPDGYSKEDVANLELLASREVLGFKNMTRETCFPCVSDPSYRSNILNAVDRQGEECMRWFGIFLVGELRGAAIIPTTELHHLDYADVGQIACADQWFVVRAALLAVRTMKGGVR